MRHFMAQLIKDVQYSDLEGELVTVKAGEIVEILKAEQPHEAIDLEGDQHIHEKDSCIASRAGVSFDVEPSDFSQVHAC